jgi:antitoxin ParD1/3/4
MATKQKTRNVALTPHFDRFVQSKIESGRYQSASEVVRDSLRIMEQHEQERRRSLQEVRRKIRLGYEQAQRGDTVDPDEVFAEIKAMSSAARKRAKKPK